MSPPVDRPLSRLWPFGALCVLLAGMLVAILALNGGHFTYSLDDAYIHLAFSEQLAQGHFGLVPDVLASPSSSILYPLLLTPLTSTDWHQFQPLAWNAAALFVSLALWRLLLRRWVFEGQPVLAALLALLAVVALNQIGLVFSGMEASLQIACSLATAIGLIEWLFAGRLRWWLIVAIVAGPLLRYENLSVSLPALAIMAVYGRWTIAVLAAAAIAMVLGGYAIYCQSIGLPPVPGSLLVKTSFDDPALGLWSGLAGTTLHLFRSIIGLRSDVPALLLIGLLAIALFRRQGRERTLIGFALVVLVAQFAFGGHGSLGRYDSHAWSVGLAVALFVHRAALQRLARTPRRFVAGAALALACLFPYTALMAPATPLAANNIYLQQFQMRRLLVEFIQSRALVNDAGLTAYRNPYRIVDLTGLGSEPIRQLRLQRPFTGPMVEFFGTIMSGTRIALVNRDWLGDIPDQWVYLGVLRLERPRISVAGSEVGIYATLPSEAARLKAVLQEFAPTLPPGARLDLP
jgi:hypothetical protein